MYMYMHFIFIDSLLLEMEVIEEQTTVRKLEKRQENILVAQLSIQETNNLIISRLENLEQAFRRQPPPSSFAYWN